MKNKVVRILVIVSLGFFLVASVLFLLIRSTRIKEFKSPALEKISLELPKQKAPISQKLSALMKTPPKKEEKRLTAVLKQMKKLFGANGFKDLAKAEAELAKVAPFLGSFRTLVGALGCWKPPSREDIIQLPTKRISYLRFLRGVRLAGYQAVILTMKNKPDEALQLLVKLSRWGQQLERECAPSLIFSMISVVVQEICMKQMLFPLVHAKLSLSMRNKGLLQLQNLAKATPNPIPNALRSEARFLDEAMKKLDGPKKGISFRMWPWWDAEQTKAWNVRSYKIEVHRAMQPYGPALWKEYAFEKKMKKVTKQMKGWRVIFHYNAVGKILFLIAKPSLLKYVLRWHQKRCLAAAYHTIIWQRILARKLPLPQGKERKRLINPLTQKPFGSFASPVCNIHSPLALKKIELKGKKVLIPSFISAP